jgi:hypothetical protein
MRALWEAIARRGEKKMNGSEFKVGLERARYVEFEDAGHSESIVLIYFNRKPLIYHDFEQMIHAHNPDIGAPLPNS